MRIYLIGPGLSPIPPTGWGAVESLIWDYYENLLKIGIDVTIINNRDLNQVIVQCNTESPDVVHIMYDDYAVIAPYLAAKKIIYTSHYAYVTHPEFEKKYKYYFQNIFKPVIENQRFLTIHSISPMMNTVYEKYGFRGKIETVYNGAREDKFRFSETPSKLNKSVYVAKVEFRKSQYKYQDLTDIDFVGNYFDSPFDIKAPNYLGEWSKSTLYESLTDYGNLILLSEGEADPLVVKEALIAGLGVVVSECSSANLDLSLPFITVIPNEKLLDLDFISQKIKENRAVSISARSQIREYAMEKFAWSSIIKKYLSLL